jgi:cobalt/nickel transport protein
MKPLSNAKRMTALGLLAVLIVAAPLALPGIKGDFNGADSKAQAIIDQSGYTPWIKPFWEAPSPEIQSLLFALQAAIGAGVLGYVLGYARGKRKGHSKTQPGRGGDAAP